MENLPQATFWDTNQSFLIIAPKTRWNDVADACVAHWKVSVFDIHEIGLELAPTVEEAREMRSIALRGAMQGKIALCRINFADQLLGPAANTLLKILEEVPKTVRFLLLAETDNALGTIQSRCSIWRAKNEAKNDDFLIPLASHEDFGTVSMKLAKLCAKGQALDVIDGWAKHILATPPVSQSTLRWLIEARRAIASSNTNAQLLLEATYAQLMIGTNIPSFEQMATRKNPWEYLKS